MASSSSEEGNLSVQGQNMPQLFDDLSRLPTEVLHKIISLLPGWILIQLENSNVKRIREIAFNIKYLDFKGCSHTSDQQLKSSISMRWRTITGLNFNQLLSMRSSVLLKAITRCKNIRMLSIKHCNLDLSDVCDIFKMCHTIETFSWACKYRENVIHFNSLVIDTEHTKNIRKLDVDFFNTHVLLWFDKNILRHCPLLEELRLVLAKQIRTLLLHSYFRMTEIYKKDCSYTFPKLHSLTLLWDAPSSIDSFNYLSDYSQKEVQYMVELLCKAKNPGTPWKKLWVQPTFIDFKSSSIFQPADTSMTALSIPSFVDDLSKVTKIPMMGIEAYEKDIDIVKCVGGKSLTHLVAIPTTGWICTVDKVIYLSSFASVLRDCTNITHLDFRGAHCENDCNTEITACAVIALKGLKKLSLSTCAISGPKLENPSPVPPDAYFTFRKRMKSETCSVPRKELFAQMVASCPLVEAFEISGCLKCEDISLMDEDLSSMHLWPQLKSLTVENVVTFRKCSFLQKIPEGCQHFQSLQLRNVGHRAVCHFAPYVMSILRKAKQLTFLGISQPMFNPNETFWKAVSHATNLRGICLTINAKRYLPLKTIADKVSKLRKLQSFHFYSCTSTKDSVLHLKNLEVRMRKVFKKGGFDLAVSTMPETCFTMLHSCVYNILSTDI